MLGHCDTTASEAVRQALPSPAPPSPENCCRLLTFGATSARTLLRAFLTTPQLPHAPSPSWIPLGHFQYPSEFLDLHPLAMHKAQPSAPPFWSQSPCHHYCLQHTPSYTFAPIHGFCLPQRSPACPDVRHNPIPTDAALDSIHRAQALEFQSSRADSPIRHQPYKRHQQDVAFAPALCSTGHPPKSSPILAASSYAQHPRLGSPACLAPTTEALPPRACSTSHHYRPPLEESSSSHPWDLAQTLVGVPTTYHQAIDSDLEPLHLLN